MDGPESESQGTDSRPVSDTLITKNFQTKVRALLGALPEREGWEALPSVNSPKHFSTARQLCPPCLQPHRLHGASWPWGTSLSSFFGLAPAGSRWPSAGRRLPPCSVYFDPTWPPRSDQMPEPLPFQLQFIASILVILPQPAAQLQLPRISVWLATGFFPVGCDLLEDRDGLTSYPCGVTNPRKATLPWHPIRSRCHHTPYASL